MRKIIFLLMMFISSSLISQTHTKFELSYEYVELYNDTLHIGTIKTHTNVDFYDNDYFLSVSSGTERVYHFIYSNSCAYDINRLTFKKTDIEIGKITIYSSEFKLFNDSIGVVIDDKEFRIITKDYKQIIFHN